MQTNNTATHRISSFFNLIWQPENLATTMLTIFMTGSLIYTLQIKYPQYEYLQQLDSSALVYSDIGAIVGGAMAGTGGIFILLATIAGHFVSTGNVVIEIAEIARVGVIFVVILAIVGGIPLWKEERNFFLPVMLSMATVFSVLIRYCG